MWPAREVKAEASLPAGILSTVQAQWLVGFSSTMQETAQTPNGMAMTLLLLGGGVDYLLMDLKQLQPAVAALHGVDKTAMAELIGAVDSLSIDNLRALKESG